MKMDLKCNSFYYSEVTEIGIQPLAGSVPVVFENLNNRDSNRLSNIASLLIIISQLKESSAELIPRGWITSYHIYPIDLFVRNIQRS